MTHRFLVNLMLSFYDCSLRLWHEHTTIGFCTQLCCEDYVEETCYSQSTGQAESCAKISDGGCPCPEGQIKCGAVGGYPGYCTDVCCDPWTEETCYSQYTGQPETCSSFADGGCPCPEGQVKCGAVDGYPGYCTSICCDQSIEETCTDTFSGEVKSCALFTDGGCPCPDGLVKCGVVEGHSGSFACSTFLLLRRFSLA
mmetsp:Transcript_29535/g.60367  ORF Transcript_29535/g.60367 Transcript_29535/m.60367 type:complete len:198 (+) Transcript_29535:2129-2722(+)